MEQFEEVETFKECPGGYALGFMARAYEILGVTDPDKVVHFFSGGVGSGITIDIRPEMNPTVVADVRSIPLPDASYDWIMADTPVTHLMNLYLYGVPSGCPSYQEYATEARRLLRIGGKLGTFDPIVPEDMPGLRRLKTYGVVFEPGRMVAGWHVMIRTQD